MDVALRYFNRVQKRQAIAIIISDFYSSDFSDILKYTARKHQVIPVWLKDPFETVFPFSHMLPIQDLEGRGQYVLGTGAGNWREEAKRHHQEREAKLRQLFKDCRVRPLVVQNDQSYLKALLKYFAVAA